MLIKLPENIKYVKVRSPPHEPFFNVEEVILRLKALN